MSNESLRHIVVTGLMGVGKSTTASALASELRRVTPVDWLLRDSDEDLEALFGVSGDVLTQRYGVDELHRMESAVLLGALAASEPTVISAAAWVVEDERCRTALERRARVVVLDLPLEHLPERIATGDHRREIDIEAMAILAQRRDPLFEQVADLRLSALQPTEELVATLVSSGVIRQGLVGS